MTKRTHDAKHCTMELEARIQQLEAEKSKLHDKWVKAAAKLRLEEKNKVKAASTIQ